MKKVLSLSLLTLLLVLSGCTRLRDFAGTWQDVNSDYQIQVTDSGIRDNISGQEVSYVRDGNEVTYVDLSRDVITTQLVFDGNSKLYAYIGDEVREFRRIGDKEFSASILDQRQRPQGEHRTFTLKSRVGLQSVELYDNGAFLIQRDAQEVSGVYVQSATGRTLTLYSYTPQDTFDTSSLYLSSDQSQVYGYKLTPDGPLSVTVKRPNAASDTPSGYLLDGVVMYEDGSVRYTFTLDGKCTVVAQNTATIVYNYSIGPTGLIYLSDEGALLSEYDYMYYDYDSNAVYRVVLESSSWDEFVRQLTAKVSKPAVAKEVAYSVSTAPTRLLPITSGSPPDPNSSHIWSSLVVLDVQYIHKSCQQIAAELERIQSDDMARREYEWSLMTEQERFAQTVRNQEEAYRKARLEMDAKMQALIAEYQTTLPTGYQYWAYTPELSNVGYAEDTSYGNPDTAEDVYESDSVAETEQP